MDLSGRISQTNGRLRAAKVGVAVEARGQKLLLRATLPPRPGSSKPNPYQQRISTGLPANPAGLKRAEAEARKLGALLATREFSWEPYIRISNNEPSSCSDWIEKFRDHYFSNGGRETTWKGDYWKIFKKLPSETALDEPVLRWAIEQTSPNTKTRRRACMALGALAKFAGVELDTAGLRGNYQPGTIDPRDIPSDEKITTTWGQIKNPAWRWVYSMMAVYGLRNHEVFHADLAELPIVRVGENTKTGSREVWPCYPEWVDAFEVDKQMYPKIELDRSNDLIGHSVTRYLSSVCGFPPYDLRHAWAIRTAIFGWPVELAARQMGHSVDMHTRTYHRWINRDHQQRVYDLLVNRNDRPRPPT